MCVSCKHCVLSGLRNELMTSPEELYTLWCITVCDLVTSRIRQPWSTLGCCSRKGGRETAPDIRTSSHPSYPLPSSHILITCFPNTKLKVITLPTTSVFQVATSSSKFCKHHLSLQSSLYVQSNTTFHPSLT
jgi:hypothetical protein